MANESNINNQVKVSAREPLIKILGSGLWLKYQGSKSLAGRLYLRDQRQKAKDKRGVEVIG